MSSQEVPHSTSDVNIRSNFDYGGSQNKICKAGSRFQVAPVENHDVISESKLVKPASQIFNPLIIPHTKKISCPVSRAPSTNIDNILYILPHSKSDLETKEISKRYLGGSFELPDMEDNNSITTSRSRSSSILMVDAESTEILSPRIKKSNKDKHIKIQDDIFEKQSFDHETYNNDRTENNSTYKKMMTYETLPNVEHYKNIFSMVKCKGRPSLTELHNQPRIPECFIDSKQKGYNGYNALYLQQQQQNNVGAAGTPQEALISPGNNGFNGAPSSHFKRIGSDKERGISSGPKFGWIKGVLIRCMLNIWGVMLFLRLSWVVGQSGIGLATLIVLLSVTVTTITSMSMSAICTNGEVKGGGAYYMISRSLGPEFGGAIGIIFSLANAVAVSMYIVGFAETVLDLISKYAGTYFGISGTNWIRIIGCSTAVLLLCVSLAGMEWEAKAQIGLLILLILAIINFIIGSFLPPKDSQKSKGFFGYKMSVFRQNMGPAFTNNENFFSVFSIFFPAATGILAGANISGDLKNAQKAIPKGTFLAILITTFVYIFMIYVLGATSLREASGHVADLFVSNYSTLRTVLLTADGSVKSRDNPLGNSALATADNIFVSYAYHLFNRSFTQRVNNGTVARLFGNARWPVHLLTRNPITKDRTNPLIQSCRPTTSFPIFTTAATFSSGANISSTGETNLKACTYGLINDYQVVDMISLFGPITTIGIFAATLSSALASLVGAPKVFQALCRDNLFPGIKYFGQGSKKNDEPYRAYLLAFFIAILFILVAQLNVIAPIISNFFLMAYALINYSCFDASLSKSIGFRPSFKYFNKWVSLFGAFLCLATMFLIQWSAAFLTFFFVISFYAYVRYKKPDVNWGSSTQANSYKHALNAVLKLNNIEEHVKNFRPQILALTGDPKSRPAFLDFVNNFTKNISLLICGHVITGQSTNMYFDINSNRVYGYFKHRKVKALYNPIVAPNVRTGVKSLLQLSGLGRLRPNILMMGYKNNWESDDMDSLNQYFNTIHDAFDMKYGVGILRLKNGLDYSFFTNQYHQKQLSYQNRLRQLQPIDNGAATTPTLRLSIASRPPPNEDSPTPEDMEKRLGGDVDENFIKDEKPLIRNGPIIVKTHFLNRRENPQTATEPNGIVCFSDIMHREETGGDQEDKNLGGTNNVNNLASSDNDMQHPAGGKEENADDYHQQQHGTPIIIPYSTDEDDENMEFDDFEFEENADFRTSGLKKNRSEIFLNQYITKPFRRVMSGLHPNTAATSGTGGGAENMVVAQTPEEFEDLDEEDDFPTSPPSNYYYHQTPGKPLTQNGRLLGVYDGTNSNRKYKKSYGLAQGKKRKLYGGNAKFNRLLNGEESDFHSGVRRGSDKSSISNIFRKFSKSSFTSSLGLATFHNTSNLNATATTTTARKGLSRHKTSSSSRAIQRFFDEKAARNTNTNRGGSGRRKLSGAAVAKALGMAFQYQEELPMLYRSSSQQATAGANVSLPKRTRKEATVQPPTSPNMDLNSEEAKVQRATMILNKKRRREAILYNKNILVNINQFHYKQKKGHIDVWWLFDDGGLTILLPYILSQRRNWESSKMRFFALSKNKKDLDIMHHNFAAMLTKFRIDYSDVIILPDIHHKPQKEGIEAFNSLIAKYRVSDEKDPHYKEGMITDAEYIALEQKTHRHIRLHEMLNQYSLNSNLIVMTLPMPRKGTCSAALYMGWLEIMTRDLPPILLLRGNQQSVLTFYS